MNRNLPHFLAILKPSLHDDSLFGGSFDTVNLRESPEASAWRTNLEDAWGLISSPHYTTTHISNLKAASLPGEEGSFSVRWRAAVRPRHSPAHTDGKKGSQQPIRCAGGGFLPVISAEERNAKGIYYGKSAPWRLSARGKSNE